MAPKKPNQMEEPPVGSSSEEEDNSSEEMTSSDDDREEDTQQPATLSSPSPQQTQNRLAVKKPETTPATPQAKSTSSEDSESESESESEPEPGTTPKPVEETPKATKPRSKPVSKRPNESEEAAKDSKSKRAKKKGPEEEEQKEAGEDTKSQLFKRLWSEGDEIVILKGMIEYWEKKGVDPNQDTQGFYDYIMESLHVEVNRNKLVDKMRRLKRKYENNLKRGTNPTFSRAHEKISFDLSKILWGIESSGRVMAKSNGKGKKNQKQKGNSKTLEAVLIDELDIDNDVHEQRNSKEKVVLFDKSVGVAGLEEFVVNEGLDIIGGAKKEELEARWKKLQIAQLELFLQRNELIKDQAKLVLDALKSSSD